MHSYRSFFSHAYAILAAALSRAVFYVADILKRFAVYAVNVIAAKDAFDWLATRYAKPIAYRVLGRLKPEYRESFATHGLSLRDLRGHC